MIEIQEASKLKILEEINMRASAMFSPDTNIFNCTVNEVDFSKLIRKMAYSNNISLNEMQNICAGYLYRKGVKGETFLEQMKAVTVYFAEHLY